MEASKIKTKKITVYSDPGHAWAKVTRHELKRLGIADQISCFSYQNKGYVFLEEDSDLFKYTEALRLKGYTITFVEKWTNRRSKIRLYDNYSK